MEEEDRDPGVSPNLPRDAPDRSGPPPEKRRAPTSRLGSLLRFHHPKLPFQGKEEVETEDVGKEEKEEEPKEGLHIGIISQIQHWLEVEFPILFRSHQGLSNLSTREPLLLEVLQEILQQFVAHLLSGTGRLNFRL